MRTPSALVSARHGSGARARLRTLHRARPCPPHCSERAATCDAHERSASGDANTPCLEGEAAVAAAATSFTSAARVVARIYVTRRARRGGRRAHASIPSAAARLKPPQLSVTAVLRPPAARLSGSAVSRHADKLAFFCAADGAVASRRPVPTRFPAARVGGDRATAAREHACSHVGASSRGGTRPKAAALPRRIRRAVVRPQRREEHDCRLDGAAS